MKDEFAYFPLRAQKYFAYFTGVSCLLWLLFAVISFSDGTERVSSNVLLCLLNAWLTIYLVKYSKQHIIFSEEGFRVVEGNVKNIEISNGKNLCMHTIAVIEWDIDICFYRRKSLTIRK